MPPDDDMDEIPCLLSESKTAANFDQIVDECIRKTSEKRKITDIEILLKDLHINEEIKPEIKEKLLSLMTEIHLAHIDENGHGFLSYRPGKIEGTLDLHIDPSVPFPKQEPQRHYGVRIMELLDMWAHEMLDIGTYERCTNPKYISYPTIVATFDNDKKIKKVRICGDYRRINTIFPKIHTKHGNIEQERRGLHGKHVYTYGDITDAFNHLVVREDQRSLLALWTPIGVLQPIRLPWGQRNAMEYFDQSMDIILQDIKGHRDEWGRYADDVFSMAKLLRGPISKETTLEELKMHLEKTMEIFKTLAKGGIHMKPSKIHLLLDMAQVLGRKISERGEEPSNKHIQVVKDLQIPTSAKELQYSFHLINYYQLHIPNYWDRATCLQELLLKGTQWKWTAQHTENFNWLRERIISHPVLVPFDPWKPLGLHTDCSNLGLGGWYSHDDKPIAYVNKKLAPNQRLWPIYVREAYAIFYCVKWGRDYIDSSRHVLIIYTDHQSLIWFKYAKGIRVQAWSILMQDVDFIIRYIKGPLNIVADALSRIKCIAEGIPTNEGFIMCIRKLFEWTGPLPADLMWIHTMDDENNAEIRTLINDINKVTNQKKQKIEFLPRTERNIARKWGTAILFPDAEHSIPMLQKLIETKKEASWAILIPSGLLWHVYQKDGGNTPQPKEFIKYFENNTKKLTFTSSGLTWVANIPTVTSDKVMCMLQTSISTTERKSSQILQAMDPANQLSPSFLLSDLVRHQTDIKTIKSEQKNDPVIRAIHNECRQMPGRITDNKRWSIRDGVLHFRNNEKDNWKLVVPSQLHHSLIERTHLQEQHGGINSTIDAILKENYYIIKMKEKVREYIYACELCEFAKAVTNAHGRFSTSRLTAPGQRIYIDFFTDLPDNLLGATAILNIMDGFSGHWEAIPMMNMTAATTADVLVDYCWRHGIPLEILSDMAKTFLAKIQQLIMQALNISMLWTGPRAQHRNRVETKNKPLRLFFKNLKSTHTGYWPALISSLTGASNNITDPITKVSPNKIHFGRELRNPSSFESKRDLNPLAKIISQQPIHRQTAYMKLKYYETLHNELLELYADVAELKDKSRQKDIERLNMKSKPNMRNWQPKVNDLVKIKKHITKPAPGGKGIKNQILFTKAKIIEDLKNGSFMVRDIEKQQTIPVARTNMQPYKGTSEEYLLADVDDTQSPHTPQPGDIVGLREGNVIWFGKTLWADDDEIGVQYLHPTTTDLKIMKLLPYWIPRVAQEIKVKQEGTKVKEEKQSSKSSQSTQQKMLVGKRKPINHEPWTGIDSRDNLMVRWTPLKSEKIPKTIQDKIKTLTIGSL